MSERPSFRRGDATPARGVGPLLGALLVAVFLGALTTLWPRSPTESLVEVEGDVPAPGTYLVTPPTVDAAVRAAGGAPGADGAREVPDGHRVRVRAGVAEVLPPSEPLLVGLPLDLNTAAVHELTAIPGLGASTAGAIVAHRDLHGPFRNLDALAAVEGLGPASIERLRPFLVVPGATPDPPPNPIDLNTADAAALERLPGVGPVMAARIVVDRDENGPYHRLDDLQRVHGVGPALVAGLVEHAVVSETP